ncbi:hypothetical protein EYZ11_001882 [Aspergillus tanneri]|uniref:Uncharacterized protein n=1 Tax=Aspergillus tanneri TaxID=1220188 RepID=A0A4V3UQD4_9EURO|nr:hypothetical protein EYZ11_001882 [Aspergillus tanneri]
MLIIILVAVPLEVGRVNVEKLVDFPSNTREIFRIVTLPYNNRGAMCNLRYKTAEPKSGYSQP